MAETYPCPVEGCDHAPFKTPQALGVHPGVAREKDTAREVPIVEVDFATAELVGGKRTDIMRKASYGTCDKAASR
jgi:hypothetical protein